MKNLIITIILLLISSFYISNFLQEGKERKTKSLYDVTIEDKTYPSVDVDFRLFSSNISFKDPKTKEFISSDNYTLKEVEVPLSEEAIKEKEETLDFLTLILGIITLIPMGFAFYKFAIPR